MFQAFLHCIWFLFFQPFEITLGLLSDQMYKKSQGVAFIINAQRLSLFYGTQVIHLQILQRPTGYRFRI